MIPVEVSAECLPFPGHTYIATLKGFYGDDYGYREGWGATKEEAIDALAEAIEDKPTDEIYMNFELSMAEEGTHHDLWPDTFGPWLEKQLEVVA